MGILTSAHLVRKEDFKKIKKSSRYTDIFFYPSDMPASVIGLSEDWNPNSFSFDKAWDDLLCILKQGGYYRTGSTLEYGTTELACNWSDFAVSYLSPSKLKQVANHLEKADAEEIKARCLAEEATDYWGDEIDECMYSYYLGDFEEFKQFLKEGVENNCYFVVCSG